MFSFLNSCSQLKYLKNVPPYPPFNDKLKSCSGAGFENQLFGTIFCNFPKSFFTILSLSGGWGDPGGAVQILSKIKTCTSLSNTDSAVARVTPLCEFWGSRRSKHLQRPPKHPIRPLKSLKTPVKIIEYRCFRFLRPQVMMTMTMTTTMTMTMTTTDYD